MHIQVLDKSKCTGCSACSNVCPKHCILMESDKCGFPYPVVSESSCVDCGMCIRVCPVLNYQATKFNHVKNIYASWSSNAETRFTSTSGGAFTELSLNILNKGGVVAGAIYDNRNLVIHEIADNKDKLEKLKQSKYLQSEIGNVYDRIKGLLENGRIALFCGTPCQVAGLKSFLGREYSNLWTVDFICRGVNSPKAYKYWLDEIEKKYSSKVRRVWFKYKKFGWKDSPRCTYIQFEDGRGIIIDGIRNTYMRGYLDGDLYLRPSCGDCLFKGKERCSDITLADFWGVEKGKDDNKGTSMIIVNTAKGGELLVESLNRLCIQEQSFEEAFKFNICFEESASINENSTRFLERIENEPFSKLINEYIPPNYKREIKRVIRHLFNKY